MSKNRIEESGLSVSEIADRLGVSRSLVLSYINKSKVKPISKKKNKFKFDSEIVLKIKERQNKKKKEEIKNYDNSISKDVLEILREQLKIKDDQIKEQGETINFLKGEVLRAQLESRKVQKLLEDKQQKEKAVSADKLKEGKLHWWQKLF